MNSLINLKVVMKVISRNLIILGSGLLLCVGLAIFYGETVMPFALTTTIVVVFGILLHLFSYKKGHADLSNLKSEAYLIVSLTWILISLFGSLPYILSGSIPSFVDAFFESVSGFTTTGSSILNDIEALPKSILFWRSLTHWIGGIGIVVLVIIVMPALHIGGYHLFSLESSLQEKIRPRIHSVGKRLLLIYLLLTFLETLLLRLGGMNLFDSLCHSFGTVATGGFSTQNDSIAGYSPYIQYVIMVFMLLAGTNFVIHYYILTKQFVKIKKDEELKFYLFIIILLGIIITISLYKTTDRSFENSFRDAFFQLISIVTCTGFATSDYLLWPNFTYLIIFFSMFLGGSTGSTAGGIKMTRHLIFFKNIKKHLNQLISPNAVITLKFNGKVFTDEMTMSILSFVSIYCFIFLIGGVLLMILKVDIKTAFSSVATCMAGIGPGIGKVGPMSNFSHLSDTVKIILSIVMLIGRLEIYTLLLIFTPSFWTKW